ncbi:putative methylase [Besnoitia besnoiti]|uniref:Putative methylase n=1 Tax=Besnoitia besnoiti TaxID=94643 RepID=A0A2A9MBP3_BESBE|nr:putative methylase [Besnoitia besnoiti]PFH32812.1 putative methylase [Besnoitia besnoiti]
MSASPAEEGHRAGTPGDEADKGERADGRLVTGGRSEDMETSRENVSQLAASMIVDVLPEANFYDTDIVASFTLTAQEVQVAHALVEANDQLLPAFTLEKLERDAVRNWDVFYKHNQGNFFKDRQWIKKEFPEFASYAAGQGIQNGHAGGETDAPLLVDVGCGVGNALVPILESFPHLHAVAFDCSKRAVKLLQDRWRERVASLPRLGTRSGHDCAASSSSSSRASSSSEPALPYTCILGPESRVSSLSRVASNPLLDESWLESSALPDGRFSNGGGDERTSNSGAADNATRSKKMSENDGTANSEQGGYIKTEQDVGDGEAESEEDWQRRKEGELKRLRAIIPFDITQSDVPSSLAPPACADYVLLLFVLSALHPRHHAAVATRVASLLKPGGILFFRDYGRYDLAQLRFAKRGKAKIADNAYARHDGTLACYFLTDELRDLFCRHAGLVEVENRYCLREFTNRKTEVKMRRIWIQAKFQRPVDL